MRPPARALRVAAAATAALAVVTSAVGPARLAQAVGLRQSPTASAGVGYLPEPTPADVRSPSIRITGLSQVRVDQPITLSDGTSSGPDTVLLQFSTIELDRLDLTRAGTPHLRISNAGSGSTTATIGGSGETVTLWGRVRSLDLCLSVGTLTTIVGSATGGLLQLPVVNQLTGLLDQLPTIACPSLTDLLPVLQILTATGVPLPVTIPAANLDIDIYALNVDAGQDATSLELPLGTVLLQ